MPPPRVAYFPDSFHEVNGVAHTSRNFVAYAERHNLPFLCVRAGNRPTSFNQINNLATLELPRSPAAIAVEKDLAFDPLFFRHAELIEDTLHRFRPDIIHLTGPSELGIFAAYFAWKLNIPLAASWHTNVHEYAAQRLLWLTTLLPNSAAFSRQLESGALDISIAFYKLARVLYAPNPDLCTLLAEATGRPCHLMQRGVDTTLFSPAHRLPQARKSFILGYVGRLSVEKNVALLPKIQQSLEARNLPVGFSIIGHGSEEESLREALPDADFKGVLRGHALSAAYADMDLLVFPSHTDTFGNVVLEALASGVPAVVTPGGGPKFIVREASSGEHETGVIAGDSAFPAAIAAILADPTRHARMRQNARAYALTCSWDAVFDRVYQGYEPILRDPSASNSSSSSTAESDSPAASSPASPAR